MVRVKVVSDQLGGKNSMFTFDFMSFSPLLCPYLSLTVLLLGQRSVLPVNRSEVCITNKEVVDVCIILILILVE